ncbi:hypothetical protein HBI81_230000 [Parastagonospora nodorum]|nr:hypothetical protein HBH53_253790 [Parastagonospora nodorum]KAH4368413.1 hypothetical protein HBH99_248160 [Parastagonospora nodorum]KAH4890803.1 hypothetical protein HBH74_235790 [Parastagonospora nodorum]KAH4893194.1 hypothetical protein HBI80_250330 [Parastagonospora nodorum]KAH4914304.1 hypothetical protein HBH73_249010 [Parastagonospora nodorum]
MPLYMLRQISAQIAPWFILISYMLLPPLYTQDWTLRLGQSTQCVLVASACSLGHLLVIICYTAQERSDPGSVLVRPVESSLFGLLSIPYNIWSSKNYVWSPASIAGIGVGAAAVSLYTALLAWGRRRAITSSRPYHFPQEVEMLPSNCSDEQTMRHENETTHRDDTYKLIWPGTVT